MHREKKSDIWAKSVLLAAAGMFLALFAHSARGEVLLPKVFADHMVIQRRMPVHVWGWAAPHEKVSVTFRGEAESTTANDLGQWEVYLTPGEAGGPFPLEIDGTNEVVFKDILVGDLWIASGQSNIEDEYQASSGMATSCLYVMVCVLMQARSRRVIRSGSMVRRLSL